LRITVMPGRVAPDFCSFDCRAAVADAIAEAAEFGQAVVDIRLLDIPGAVRCVCHNPRCRRQFQSMHGHLLYCCADCIGEHRNLMRRQGISACQAVGCGATFRPFAPGQTLCPDCEIEEEARFRASLCSLPMRTVTCACGRRTPVGYACRCGATVQRLHAVAHIGRAA
jgi:hypothetical protein